jgi:hypothetical protein
MSCEWMYWKRIYKDQRNDYLVQSDSNALARMSVAHYNWKTFLYLFSSTSGKCCLFLWTGSHRNMFTWYPAETASSAAVAGETAEEKTAAETQICEECEAPRAKTRQGAQAKSCFECGHNFSDTTDKTPNQAQASRGKVDICFLGQFLNQTQGIVLIRSCIR